MADADELLRDEYIAIHNTIEEFDSRALTIKAWSVTVSAVGLATAYIENEPSVLLIAVASAFVFWFVEGLWKASQSAYYPRIEAIERYFRSPGESKISPFQIAASRDEALEVMQKERRALGKMPWPHVSFPHLPIIVIGLLLYWAAPPTGVKTPNSPAGHSNQADASPPPS